MTPHVSPQNVIFPLCEWINLFPKVFPRSPIAWNDGICLSPPTSWLMHTGVCHCHTGEGTSCCRKGASLGGYLRKNGGERRCFISKLAFLALCCPDTRCRARTGFWCLYSCLALHLPLAALCLKGERGEKIDGSKNCVQLFYLSHNHF